jgi:hypothetical protein
MKRENVKKAKKRDTTKTETLHATGIPENPHKH